MPTATLCSFCAPLTVHFPRRAGHRKYRTTLSQMPKRIALTPARASATTDAIVDFVSSKLAEKQDVKIYSAGSSGWALMNVVRTPNGKSYFIKSSRDPSPDMFTGEAEGLRALHHTNTVIIPKVYHVGKLSSGLGSFIVMDNLDFGHIVSMEDLGTKVAQMHLADPLHEEARNGKFGFAVDNTIGGTHQPNDWTDDWIKFFARYRLQHQLSLANDRDLSYLGKKLISILPEFFRGITVKPSVLHGDLWSGNYNSVKEGPVLFDPATYYGHHEAEFGMSWCAGLSASFWDKYHELIPKEPGFETRKELYMLYHYLNHFNLFGGSYYGICISIMRKLTKS